jgi:hypothetical protein
VLNVASTNPNGTPNEAAAASAAKLKIMTLTQPKRTEFRGRKKREQELVPDKQTTKIERKAKRKSKSKVTPASEKHFWWGRLLKGNENMPRVWDIRLMADCPLG